MEIDKLASRLLGHTPPGPDIGRTRTSREVASNESSSERPLHLPRNPAKTCRTDAETKQFLSFPPFALSAGRKPDGQGSAPGRQLHELQVRTTTVETSSSLSSSNRLLTTKKSDKSRKRDTFNPRKADMITRRISPKPSWSHAAHVCDSVGTSGRCLSETGSAAFWPS